MLTFSLLSSSSLLLILVSCFQAEICAFSKHPRMVSWKKYETTHRSTTDLLVTPLHTSSSSGSIFKPQDRAQFLNTIATLATLLSPINSRASAVVTGIKDGNLPDLPTEAVRSYLQYRIPLQISVDYYLFELQDKVKNIEDWGDVSQLFVSSGARGGQGQPNRMERDFINPMRILELAMPPEDAEKLQAARNTFEQAMQLIQKATVGIRRDLPIEISSKDIAIASKGWEDGRVALNQYIVALNSATGLTNELRTIPASDDQQISQYGRSPRKFFDLLKKSKQCQNRGGPTIAQGWGGLMISGYMQDSCGIPDLEDYFFQ